MRIIVEVGDDLEALDRLGDALQEIDTKESLIFCDAIRDFLHDNDFYEEE